MQLNRKWHQPLCRVDVIHALLFSVQLKNVDKDSTVALLQSFFWTLLNRIRPFP